MLRWLTILFWSSACFAAHPSFLLPFIDGDKPWSIQQYLEGGNWLECDEKYNTRVWCGEEFRYYTLQVWPEIQATQSNTVDTLVLHADYIMNDWTSFQLSLRKDGFKLQFVQYGEQLFSITDQLVSSTMENIDKELVLFINRNIRLFPKTMVWDKKTVRAKLITDGKIITLTFMQY